MRSWSSPYSGGLHDNDTRQGYDRREDDWRTPLLPGRQLTMGFGVPRLASSLHIESAMPWHASRAARVLLRVGLLLAGRGVGTDLSGRHSCRSDAGRSRPNADLYVDATDRRQRLCIPAAEAELDLTAAQAGAAAAAAGARRPAPGAFCSPTSGPATTATLAVGAAAAFPGHILTAD